MNAFISHLAARRRARKLKRIRRRRIEALADDLWERDEEFHMVRIDALSEVRGKEAARLCFVLAFLLSTTLTAALGGVGLPGLVVAYLLGAGGLAWAGGGLHSTQDLIRTHERQVSEIKENGALLLGPAAAPSQAFAVGGGQAAEVN